jgi:DNA polymerase-1
MKILSLDCENSYNILNPWEEGFYLTNVGLVQALDGVVYDRRVVWFDHCTHAPTKDGIATIQDAVDVADVITGQNIKHDINILRYFGVNFDGKMLHDVMVVEYLLSGQDTLGREFNLNAIAKHYGVETKDDKVRIYWDRGVDTYDIPEHILEPYVIQDCMIPLEIYPKQIEGLAKWGMVKLAMLQNEFIMSLSDIELNGFRFDADRGEEIIEEYTKKAEVIADEIREMVGEPHLNVGSGQQKSAILYGGVLKLSYTKWTMHTYKTIPETKYWEKTYKEEKEVEGLGFDTNFVPKGEDGYFSTSKETIEKLPARTKKQRRIKKLLLEHSGHAKIISTLRGKQKHTGLLNKIQPDGKIHSHLKNAFTRTGRLSSENPNSQNFPRYYSSPIKECVIPEFDGILQTDLSQIEWRDAGELSADQVMIREVNGGVDQHNETCTKLMELVLNKENRNNAKIFNFRMIYGGSPFGFYLDIKMPKFPIAKWKKIVKGFFAKYFGLKLWHDTNIALVFRDGMLQIKTGRRFVFHKTKFKEGIYTYSENQIKNYPVQGMAGGDCLPLCAVVIRRGMLKHGLKSKMILTVHDSIVFDYIEEELPILAKLCSEVANNLHTYMANYFGIKWYTNLAGEIEIGKNYGKLKKFDV